MAALARVLRTSIGNQLKFKNLDSKRFLHMSAVFSHKKGIEKQTIQDASTFLNNMLLSCKGAAIFAGTGQYHEEKEQDRLVMLNFMDDFLQDSAISVFDSQELLDLSLIHI